MNPEECAWLDGERFAKWLLSIGIDSSDTRFGASFARGMRRWKEGQRLSLSMADRACVLIGRHLSDIPDDCWLQARAPRRTSTEAERAEALAAMKEGASPEKLAKELGFHESTVRKWATVSRKTRDSRHALSA